MKFGLESEKFLFDLKYNRPSEGVFHFIDALSDYDSVPLSLRHITNEFVLNMVEIVTSPSERPMDVIKDYIFNYLMLNSVSHRESVTTVGLGSLPIDYQPHMAPKWPYFVQNCILERRLEPSWILTKDSALTPAGNCAGIHIHIEISSQPEYLFLTDELKNKFNMGLMLSPMIAFSSSPYFFGKHQASSMRGERYFNGIYKNFPLNGGLPPVMESSEDVLKFFQSSVDTWINEGKSVGLPEKEFESMIKKKGASWNPVRWNRTWNTIELRCLDSDRIDLDCAKFIWICSAMKRLDIKGEGLECSIMPLTDEVSLRDVEECFEVQDGRVNILPTHALNKIFARALKNGLKDPFISLYLERLSAFAKEGLNEDEELIFNILEKVLESRSSTSDKMLGKTNGKIDLQDDEAISLIKDAVDDEHVILQQFIKKFPDSSHQWSRLIN